MGGPNSRHRVKPDRPAHHSPPVYRASVLLSDAQHPKDHTRQVLAVSDHATHQAAEEAVMEHIVNAPFGYGEEGKPPRVVVASNIFTIKGDKR